MTSVFATRCYAQHSIAAESHLLVRLSVTLMTLYCWRMCWVSSKVITKIISLGSSHFGDSSSSI